MNSRRTRLRSVLAAILTVLVLVPTAVLFARVWRDNSDQRADTKLERQGVQYLTALAPLISALAEAQSTALQGVAEPPDSLKAAVTRVAAVDSELGGTLRTKERWAGLREKIDKLTRTNGNPLLVYQAHVEVSDLTLALYNAVRRNSQLNRDPDNDLSNLQQATAIDMPTAVARVSRMGDLANILQAADSKTRPTVAVQFGQEMLAVQDSVNSLTDNLQAAVDNTNSASLSGSLVSTLDSFRRAVESMTRGANPGSTPNAAAMATAQNSMQTALNNLAGVTLQEMNRLLGDRLDRLDRRRTEAIVMGALAVLLVLAAVLWPLISRRREESRATAVAADSRNAGESTRDITSNRPAGPPGYAATPYDPVPQYGEVDPTRRERSGVLR